MFKTGVWRPQDLPRRKTLLGTLRTPAYTLLRTSVPASPDEIAQFEAVIKTVWLSFGSCRTTYPGRLTEVNRAVDALAVAAFPPDAPIEVCDWGVSDALVSLEWAEPMLGKFHNARFTASDLILWFTEARNESGETLVFEPDGTPLQYIRPPFVVSLAHPEQWIYPLNRLVARRGWQAAAAVQWNGVPDPQPAFDAPWTFRQIPLIHPSALDFAARQPRFRISLHDAFTPLAAPCHILRTMNLLNPAVFGRDQAAQGLRAAADSIAEGGLYILGRTDESQARTNNVSIFRKTGGGFSVIGRLGQGSELEDLALSAIPPK